MIKNWLKNFGPGPLIAAAFIGPGTVTVCTLAGVNFGYTLLWAMLLSVFATVVLQEMAARLGIVSQKGLSEVIRAEIQNPLSKFVVIVLILSAIVIGNAAYEAGNISGAVLGLETMFKKSFIIVGGNQINTFSLIIGGIAFILLYVGNYKFLERVLISLVILMSCAFMITAVMTQPDIGKVLNGLFVPKISSNSLLTVIALIGTTVVPYNLFLHSALVKTKWSLPSDLKFARKDTIVAVVLGGIVSMCIMISAATIQSAEINNASDLAQSLEPLFGEWAKMFLAVGLCAAGVTSAITAPLAASFVACGCLGWSTKMTSRRFRVIWLVVLLLGVVFSSIGFKSIEIIKFAQVANGLLLPIIAGFLLWIMNKGSVLGVHKNSFIQNGLGILVLGVSIFLGVKSILKVFGI